MYSLKGATGIVVIPRMTANHARYRTVVPPRSGDAPFLCDDLILELSTWWIYLDIAATCKLTAVALGMVRNCNRLSPVLVGCRRMQLSIDVWTDMRKTVGNCWIFFRVQGKNNRPKAKMIGAVPGRIVDSRRHHRWPRLIPREGKHVCWCANRSDSKRQSFLAPMLAETLDWDWAAI